MGPRPDHINDPSYDRSAVDLDGLVLLGQRQLDLLESVGTRLDGSRYEVCAFANGILRCEFICMAANRIDCLADLDSNAWPQKGRNNALREIRRAWAPHLCGDQHLSVVVKAWN